MINFIETIITKFLALAEEFFNYIFEGVQFNVLWNWLPQDIQNAASSFIIILFAVAIIMAVRKFLPL